MTSRSARRRLGNTVALIVDPHHAMLREDETRALGQRTSRFGRERMGTRNAGGRRYDAGRPECSSGETGHVCSGAVEVEAPGRVESRARRGGEEGAVPLMRIAAPGHGQRAVRPGDRRRITSLFRSECLKPGTHSIQQPQPSFPRSRAAVEAQPMPANVGHGVDCARTPKGLAAGEGDATIKQAAFRVRVVAPVVLRAHEPHPLARRGDLWIVLPARTTRLQKEDTHRRIGHKR